MFSRATAFLAALFLFSGAPNALQLARAQTAPPTPATSGGLKVSAVPAPITAETYFVMDLDSGRVLDARNPDKRMFPASTTKLMTCLLATENGKLTDIIRASPAAATTGESGIGLIAGENQTLADLLRAAMIRSANDACVDIAEGVGGSQTKFVAMMNARARQLGARNTHFVNPHGLHNPNHFTTARDLALIGQAVTRVDFLNQTARTKTEEIGGNYKIGPKRLILNRNKLLWRWDKCDGPENWLHQASRQLSGRDGDNDDGDGQAVAPDCRDDEIASGQLVFRWRAFVEARLRDLPPAASRDGRQSDVERSSQRRRVSARSRCGRADAFAVARPGSRIAERTFGNARFAGAHRKGRARGRRGFLGGRQAHRAFAACCFPECPRNFAGENGSLGRATPEFSESVATLGRAVFGGSGRAVAADFRCAAPRVAAQAAQTRAARRGVRAR